MKIVIKGKRLKEGVGYRGVIKKYKRMDEKLIISVVFNKDPETEYIKSVQIDGNVNSAFVKLAEELDIIDEDETIDTDYLDGMHIIANLQSGYDNRYYIDRMAIDNKYYEKLEDANGDGTGETGQ